MTSRVMKGTLAVLAGGALLLGACSSGATRSTSDGQRSGTEGGAATQAPAAGGGGAKAGKGAFLLTVTGGPYPGKYEARNVELPCIAVASNTSFGAVYGNEQDTGRIDGVVSLTFETRTYKGLSETKQFRFAVALIKPGQMLGDYFIDPDRQEGSGTAAVDERGGSVRVSGQTKDGEKIDARVDCGEVGRF